MKIYIVTDNSREEYEKGCNDTLIATTTLRAALKYIADEMEAGIYGYWGLADEEKEDIPWYGASAGRELNKLLAIPGAEGNAAVDTFDAERLVGVSINETRLYTDLYRETECNVRPDRYEIMEVVEAIGEYKQKKYHDALEFAARPKNQKYANTAKM
jgi:hypothetical protein